MKKLYLFILSLILTSCLQYSNKQSTTDSFYTEKGEWDSARIPLLKPYEAILTSKEFGWCVNLFGNGDTGLPNTVKVAVKDDAIFLYNINTILDGKDEKQSWHIIIPSKRLEKGFSKYQDYKKYLNKLNIREEPKLFNIELVASYFDDHQVMSWDDFNKEHKVVN
ncbi:hypothetical protein [Mucilaginibacter sp. KACC 22063]|uniref:hypothetical protein n=1 Tax=Mucilaginibacter sp. KACC 22063 TaxID=3025666 RepID=UPI0023664E91|nr:hypothetical protein [Mucilaginibacter sp. KACC 22063]WDF55238.1 hypothetical protein PQ461_20100 [Mucilaginibacter sp. KACC 22063]